MTASAAVGGAQNLGISSSVPRRRVPLSFHSPDRGTKLYVRVTTYSSLSTFFHRLSPLSSRRQFIPRRAPPRRPVVAELAFSGVQEALQAFAQSPPTWQSSLLVTSTVFALGFPALASGLTLPGIAAAYVLGLVVWRAFGLPGFFTVCLYFVAGTAATKMKLKQKEKEGIAEKRKGRRGPESVAGSGAAGIVCALLSIWANAAGTPGAHPVQMQTTDMLLQLAFVASFSTKLSDTTSSEIGKAYGRTTYLVTTLEQVPRGTEGAISLEGTLAGLVAALLLAASALALGQVSAGGALLCVLASQVANYGESYIGATLQDKPGYEWLNNDVVNVLNISMGALLAAGLGSVLLA